MKGIINKSSMIAMAITATAFTSCSRHFEFYDPVKDVTDKYATGWQKVFGDIDSNQDWNLATQVKADIDLSATDVTSVTIYSAVPGAANSMTAAVFEGNKGVIYFDFPKDATDVYVVAKDNNGKSIISDYFEIHEGVVSITNAAPQRASSRAMAVGSEITNFGSFYDSNQYWGLDYWFNQYNMTVDYNKVFKLYNMTGVERSNASSWKISDLMDIVGSKGVFGEQGLDAQGNCNRKHWEKDLAPSKGAEFVLEADGPVEMSYMYGGTQKKNMFGYLYYADGATQEQILNAPRFILIDDASPQANVKVNGTAMGSGDGMKLPSLVQNHEFYNGSDFTLTGTKYKLAYYGADGKGAASYTFPKGTHIVFFEIIDGLYVQNNYYGPYIRYSLPWMNKLFYYKLYEYHPRYQEGEAAQDFVTYKWGGQIVLGMEDEGGDDDMNDILFFINGNIKDNDIPEIGEEPQDNSWIIACEDLGSTDDYDFNDVVFKVSHVAGQTTATVTPLAAGGVYESHIMYGITDLGETHQLLGANPTTGNYPMINTSRITAQGTSKIISVSADFSLANGMGSFGIKVNANGSNKDAMLITAPSTGTAPQIFCVPGSWAWPTERTPIQEAYPQFSNWSANTNNIEWYKSPIASKVLK